MVIHSSEPTRPIHRTPNSRPAAAILAALDAPQPPLRLALGDAAVDQIRAKHERLRADLDGWEATPRGTAFETSG